MMRRILLPLFPLILLGTMIGRACWRLIAFAERKWPTRTKRQQRAQRWKSRHERKR